jgi:hypothetical protein
MLAQRNNIPCNTSASKPNQLSTDRGAITKLRNHCGSRIVFARLGSQLPLNYTANDTAINAPPLQTRLREKLMLPYVKPAAAKMAPYSRPHHLKTMCELYLCVGDSTRKSMCFNRLLNSNKKRFCAKASDQYLLITSNIKVSIHHVWSPTCILQSSMLTQALLITVCGNADACPLKPAR